MTKSTHYDYDVFNMYLEHFNLLEKPFHAITSNPRFFYQAPQYSQVRLKIDYFVKDRGGHIFIFGPIGSGKTTLLKIVGEQLAQDEHNLVKWVIVPKLKTGNAFIRRINEEFGVKTERSFDGSVKNFVDFLKGSLEQGLFPVLLVDEAENLNRECLKLIHYLLAYTTDEDIYLMVVLCGQEDLATNIKKMKELLSRMFPAAVSSLSREETENMMKHRWAIASQSKSNPFPFSAEAVDLIYKSSRGIPRNICRLTDLALLATYAAEQMEVIPEFVEQARQQEDIDHE
ncbi:MAG: AAA family ATPase [Anaerolineae bacterium]|nr:AAA family ATPase [Anaerolineae bacterium]